MAILGDGKWLRLKTAAKIDQGCKLCRGGYKSIKATKKLTKGGKLCVLSNASASILDKSWASDVLVAFVGNDVDGNDVTQHTVSLFRGSDSNPA